MAMSLADADAIGQALHELFRLEREADELRTEIVGGPHIAVLDALKGAFAEARSDGDERRSALALTSIANLLGHLRGPDVVDMLVDVLAADDPDVRHAAGGALEHLAFERFKEVALGIERALDRLAPDCLALRELPYVLVDLPEPGVLKLLQKFLGHSEAEVVAAGLEACLEVGDPALVPAIARLAADRRSVELEDEEADENAEPMLVTIGELAQEAMDLLQPEGRDLQTSGGHQPKSPGEHQPKSPGEHQPKSPGEHQPKSPTAASSQGKDRRQPKAGNRGRDPHGGGRR